MLKAAPLQMGLMLLMFLVSTSMIRAQSGQDKSPVAAAVGNIQAGGSVVQATPAPADPPAGANFNSPSVSPLMGGQSFGVGSSITPHDFFLPSIQWTSYYGDNPAGYSQTSRQNLQSTFVGNLRFQRVSRSSLFDMNYSGGVFYYNHPVSQTQTVPLNKLGSFDSLEFTEQISSRRWTYFIGDEGSYMPESPLGFQGMGGLSTFGSGLSGPASAIPGLNSYFTSNQSIISGNARRFDNTTIAQMQYSASARSTWNVTGSYGTLQFLDPGYIDSDSIRLTIGYTRQMSRSDYISLNYVNSWMHFHIPNRDFLNRGFIAAYGHQITGRLALEVSGGVLFNQFALPLGGSITQSMLTTEDSLHYHGSRYDMSVSFNRGVGEGSGLLAGSQGDMVRGEVSRSLFRAYRLSFHLDDAFNRSLRQFSPAQRGNSANYWEGGATVSRHFGSNISIYLDYVVQRQAISGAICGAPICAESFYRQSGGIGINWHARPIRVF